MFFNHIIAAIRFVIFVLCLQERCWAKRHIIYWDGSIMPGLKNEIMIDVRINDWMDILCPHKSNYNQSSMDSSMLYLELYNVSAEQYKHCVIRGQRRVLHCKDPRQEIKLTTKFQERSPSPIGFVFSPGHTYYYISRPTRERKIGCTKDTMRLVVNVREDNYEQDGKTLQNKQHSGEIDYKSPLPPRKHHHPKITYHRNEEETKSAQVKIVAPKVSSKPSPSTGKKDGENSALSALKSTSSNKFVTMIYTLSVLVTLLLTVAPYA